MFQIIIWILKIIGILLSVILGIAVLLVCIVLFVPVRYRIEGKGEGELDSLDVLARFSWLFHLLSGYFRYQNGVFCWQIRIGWKKLRQDTHSEDTPSEDIHSKDIKKDVKKNVESEDTPSLEDKHLKDIHDIHSKDLQKEKIPEKETGQKHRKQKKISLVQKIKHTYQRMCDKLKRLLDTKEKLLGFLSDTVHRSAWKRLKKEAFRLLRFLRPKKILGSVEFGLEDPYNTGRILAVLSMLYPFYGEYIDIYPNFEQQILRGNLLVKGHIRGIYAAAVLWNLFFDKDVKATYQHIKTFKF